jgi:DNA adenine methylase
MKYMGSKNRIAKHILPIILKDRKDGQCYVETMVGGANTISKVSGYRIGSDVNSYLINFFKALQIGWTPPKGINKELYNKINKNKEDYPAELVGCVGFCFTYAAKWFGGFIGNSKDVVCVGRDRMGESYRSVEKATTEVYGVELFNCSYSDLKIPVNSIIYCDPPYEGTTKYKDCFNHADFWQWCRDKAKEGHSVFISEYNAPSDFICVWEKEINSSLTKNTGGKKGIEKLFIHESQKSEVVT